MINAFKRLVAPNSNEIKDKENASNGSNTTPGSVNKNGSNNTIATLPASFLNNGMQMISQSLQKKFSKGVNYNMKIVIRGDCNVGKTTLWLRLQGQPFKEAYETSEEIKVANIQWSFKSTDDIVKVEVWDVVDRSKKKRNLLNQPRNASNSISLKLDNETINGSKQAVEASLDAEFIDVYKNANGVILVYDITKQWTWDYIEREVPRIPTHIPLLIIGNHRDMNHHRCIDELKCKYFIENLNRGSLGSAIRYTETSMRTGFGLKYIHKFFNIPFLQLQRETLMQHLETNAKEMDAICEELQEIEENIENDYDEFSMSLNTTRRQQQEENAKDILKNAKTIEEARKLAAEKEAAAALSAQIEAQQDPKKAINQFINKINSKVTQIAQVSSPTPISMSVTVDTNDKKNKSLTNLTNSISHNSLLNKNPTKNTNPINELPHDDELDRFLDDPLKTNKPFPNNIPHETKAIIKNDDDDDEDEIGSNPMVTIVKDTIDSSDESELKFKTSKLASTKASNVQQIDLSDDDESEKLQFKSTTKKQVKNKTSPNGEFVFVNNKSTNNSTYSNSSNDASNVILQNSDIRQNPTQAVLDTFSTTSSIVNLDIGNNVSKSENASNTDQTQQFQLTNDDFDFLEKMTTVDKEAKISSSSKTKKASSDKKIKSSKSSSKISEDSQSFNDESSQNSSNKKTKKNKDSSEVKEKKEKRKSKSSSKKSSRKQQEDEEDEDEDDNKNHVSVKKDEDYEEL